MIDSDGYRANVGIILSNADGQVFWARRNGQNAWQFPQGGIQKNESPDDAMYRELEEETGLHSSHVEIMGKTKDWLAYKIPEKYLRLNTKPLCIGQKQMWYVLRFNGSENDVDLACYDNPEFDQWKWVDYWYPLNEIVSFKRDVYEKALRELEPLLSM